MPQPEHQPVLRLETGMHTVSIRRIATDAQGRWLVTASDDKTARVWDLATGQLLRTLRPPIGSGNEGKLYAVAMSPDGNTVAVGGWTSPDGFNTNIYLFDRASGRLTQRLAGLPNLVSHLAFAPDGRWLAATLGGTNGVRVYDAAQGYRLAFSDTAYGNDSYGADFTPDGSGLATSCFDGQLRRYTLTPGNQWQLTATQPAPGGKQPDAVKFAPDGTRLAVGYADTTRVTVVAGRELGLLYEPDTRGVDNGNLVKVAWSRDGARLYAGGRWSVQNNAKPLRVWSAGGRGTARDVVTGARNTIFDLAAAGGGVAYGAGGPSWGLVEETGREARRVTGALADYRGLGENFRLAAGGLGVQFGYEYRGAAAGHFSVSGRELRLSELAGGSSPVTAAGGLQVTDWYNTTAPKLNGQPLALAQYETSRSLAIARDGSAFLLGTEYYLRCYERAGRSRWQAAIPGGAWAVNVSEDGRLAVAAFGDGTIRWYRMTDGAELLAFFPHGDKQRWVLWTPSGYYDASPGAEDLIGWHVNNGPEEAADFYPVGLFRERFYRPEVVAKVLYTLDEAKAVRLADDAAQHKTSTLSLAAQLPPVVEIVMPTDGDGVAQCDITVRVRIRRPSREPLTGIRILIDGRPVETERGLGAAPSADEIIALPVTVPERDCEISVIAENRYAASVPASTRVLWLGRRAGFVIKPNLYVTDGKADEVKIIGEFELEQHDTLPDDYRSLDGKSFTLFRTFTTTNNRWEVLGRGFENPDYATFDKQQADAQKRLLDAMGIAPESNALKRIEQFEQAVASGRLKKQAAILKAQRAE